MTASPPRRAERVEVARSREQILLAAEQLIAAGRVVTMASLSEASGVSSAALYRRYPDVDAVIRALHAKLMTSFDDIAVRVAQQTSGWDAIVTMITGITEAFAEHPALPHVYRRMAQMDPQFQLGPQWDEPLNAVTRVAQAEGALRPDVDGYDVTIAAFRLGEFAHHPEPARSNIMARQLALTIDGLRASSAHTPMPGSPVSGAQINALLQHEGARLP